MDQLNCPAVVVLCVMVIAICAAVIVLTRPS